jgi:hypothetical protein
MEAFVAFWTTEWEHIKTALLIVTPVLSSVGTWHAAHKKLLAEAETREVHQRNEEVTRIEQQRETLHVDMLAQNEAMRKQFQLVVDAVEARNRDLYQEVASLRLEVSHLRRALDQYRVSCVGCPKMPFYPTDHNDDHPAAPSA